MLLEIFLILCVVLLIIKFKTKNAVYWKKKNVLEIGDLFWAFSFDSRSMPEVSKTVYDKYNEPYIGTYLGSTPALMVKTPEDIQAVFAGDFQSFTNRGIITNPNDILADNLLFMDNFPKWKLIRQKITPVFTSSKLKNMFYIIEKCARDFVKFVENSEQKKHKPFNFLYTYTTSSVGAAVFGIDTQTKDTMDSPFIDMAWKSITPSVKTKVIFFISSVFPKLFQFLQLKFFGEHEEFFVGVVKNVLETRRQDKTGIKRYDFIELCLELQKLGMMHDPTTGFELYPSDEVIAAQAFFFFFAGTDTTANAMHFTLLALSANQKVLAKLHEEIDSIFKDGKEELTYADIDSLQYLDMVVSEGMRKYPPIGIIQRICTKDTVLPSNVKIEKDTAIIIPVYGIHRDEKYYPNPDKFDPERFRPDNALNINKYTYLPFGEGNRICIGVRFARLQIKAGLAWLLRRYTLAEQSSETVKFEKSSFGLRDPEARYDFIPRNIK